MGVAARHAERARRDHQVAAPFYHQRCIRYTIKVSTIDTHFAAVFFRFVPPKPGPGCKPFDGQVVMKRLTAARWKKIAEASSWSCQTPGVPTRKELFGGCAPY